MASDSTFTIFAQYGALGIIAAIFIYSTLQISNKFIDYLTELNKKTMEENARNMHVLEEHTNISKQMNTILFDISNGLKENNAIVRKVEEAMTRMERK